MRIWCWDDAIGSLTEDYQKRMELGIPAPFTERPTLESFAASRYEVAHMEFLASPSEASWARREQTFREYRELTGRTPPLPALARS